MEQLTFITKNSTFYSSKKDVSIHSGNNKGDSTSANLVFRNACFHKISPNTGYVVYSVKGSRVYFKEASSREGFKLSKSHKVEENNRYMTFKSTMHPALNEWCLSNEGDYDLMWDKGYGLWYIDSEELRFNTKHSR